MGRRKKAKGGDGYFHRKTRKEGGKEIEYGNWLTKYYITVTDEDGKKKRIARYVNHGTDDYNAAMALHLEWVKLYQSGSAVEYEQILTVQQWLTNWLTKKRDDATAFGTVKKSTIARYEAIIAGFLSYTATAGISDLSIAKFETEHLKKYPLFRITQTRFGKKGGVPITKQGANRDLKFMKCLFKEAFEDGVIPTNITKGVAGFKLPVEQPQELLTPEQLLEVFDCIDEQEAKDIAEATALMGSRSGELAYLKWENIDFVNHMLTIQHEGEGKWSPKNASSNRVVPIPDDVFAILKRLRSARSGEPPSEYVFKMPDGRPFNEFPNYAYRRITKALKLANRRRKAAGAQLLPKVHLRLLRHWFVSQALNREDDPLSENEMIKLVGHVDCDMARKHYYHPDLKGTTGRKMRSMSLKPKNRGCDQQGIA
jgi:integrase